MVEVNQDEEGEGEVRKTDFGKIGDGVVVDDGDGVKGFQIMSIKTGEK